MGDLMGSNVCDLLLATGLGAVISGFVVDSTILRFDLPVLFLATILFLYFLLRNEKIEKKEGIIMIVLFILYASYRIFIS
jgi:cation:H+ antiporter